MTKYQKYFGTFGFWNSFELLALTLLCSIDSGFRPVLTGQVVRIQKRVYLLKGGGERGHKPSSVIPTPLFSGDQENGHLSRTLIAQGLKRPHPSRLCPNHRVNLNGLFSPLFRGAESIWSCSGWGLPSYPNHSGYW